MTSIALSTPLIGLGKDEASAASISKTSVKEIGLCKRVFLYDDLTFPNLNSKFIGDTLRYEADPYIDHAFSLNERHQVQLIPKQRVLVNLPNRRTRFDYEFQTPIIPPIRSTKEEDKKCVELINIASGLNGNVKIGKLSPDNINHGFALVERHDLVVAKILINPITWDRIKNIRDVFGDGFFISDSSNEPKITTNYGATNSGLWTANFFVHNSVPVDKVLFLADSEFLGVVTDSEDIYGMSIICPKSISTLHLKDFGQRYRLRLC
jgi:hypothetical protein